MQKTYILKLNTNKCCIIVILSPVCTAIMEYTDMPSLSCCRCNLVKSKGGDGWERENPSELVGFCNCPTNGTVGIHSGYCHKDMEDIHKIGRQTLSIIKKQL